MFMEMMPMQLTDNEVNNLIYTLIKFGFRKIKTELASPPNSLIHEIMLEVSDDHSTENIIEKTLLSVIVKYRISLRDVQLKGLREHMRLIHKLFMSEPYELRNDLGEDKNAEEFITKH